MSSRRVQARSRLLALATGLAALLAAAPAQATIAWSPDGRWLAFTEREGPAPVAPGWLFTPRPIPKPAPAPNNSPPNASLPAPMSPVPANTAPPLKAFRIWITSADGRDVKLVAESKSPLDGLAWHPWESKLAYVRIGEATQAGEPWQVVLHAGADRPERVLYSEVVPKANFQRTPSAYALAWRPDGAVVAAVIGDALLTLDARSGEVLGKRARGAAPSWSPTGERLAFQQLRADNDWVQLIGDTTFANVDGGHSNVRRMPPAIWEEDGDLLRLTAGADHTRNVANVSITRTRTIKTSDEPFTDRGDLLTVAIPDRAPGPIVVHAGPPPVAPKYEGAWLASVDPRTLFFLLRRSDRPTRLMAIEVAHPDRPEWCSPIDAELRLSELALSPDGRRLATRAGRPDEGCPLIYHLGDRRTTFLAASPNLRLAALLALAEAVESVALKGPRPATPTPFLARVVAPVPPTITPPTRHRAPPALEDAIRFGPIGGNRRSDLRGDDDYSPERVSQLVDAATALLAKTNDDEATESRALDELRLFFAFAKNDAAADALWNEAFARLAAAPRSAEENVRLLALDARRLRRRGRTDAALVRLDEAQDALERAVKNHAIKPDVAATLTAVLEGLLQSNDDAPPPPSPGSSR